MRIKQNRGFTLVQLVIALSLAAVMGTVVVGMFDTTGTKTEALVGRIKAINAGLAMSKQDMNCYPDRLDGLLKPTTSTFCGPVSGGLWKGAYIGLGTPYDPVTGNILLDDIVPNAQVRLVIRVVSGSTGVTSRNYVLSTVGLTEDFARQAELICGADADSRCGVDNTNQLYWVIEPAPEPVQLEYNELSGTFTAVPVTP